MNFIDIKMHGTTIKITLGIIFADTALNYESVVTMTVIMVS